MFFFVILATAISDMPTPERCFLPGQFRRTISPKEHHVAHPVSVNWTHNLPVERRTLPLAYRRANESFVANA